MDRVGHPAASAGSFNLRRGRHAGTQSEDGEIFQGAPSLLAPAPALTDFQLKLIDSSCRICGTFTANWWTRSTRSRTLRPPIEMDGVGRASDLSKIGVSGRVWDISFCFPLLHHRWYHVPFANNTFIYDLLIW